MISGVITNNKRECYSSGKSSDEDLKVAKNWLADMNCVYTRAVVHRYNGLTIYGRTQSGAELSLGFQHALCGYAGTGPHTTAQILVLFGFGNYGDLLPKLVASGEVEFVK